MALVSLGACCFTLCSQFAFKGSPQKWDAARVSAAVPAGVGFIGAGLIFKASTTVDGIVFHHVNGLTTAASVWLASAVGTTAGGRMGLISLYTVLLVIIILRFGPHMYFQDDDDDYDDDMSGSAYDTPSELNTEFNTSNDESSTTSDANIKNGISTTSNNMIQRGTTHDSNEYGPFEEFIGPAAADDDGDEKDKFYTIGATGQHLAQEVKYMLAAHAAERSRRHTAVEVLGGGGDELPSAPQQRAEAGGGDGVVPACPGGAAARAVERSRRPTAVQALGGGGDGLASVPQQQAETGGGYGVVTAFPGVAAAPNDSGGGRGDRSFSDGVATDAHEQTRLLSQEGSTYMEPLRDHGTPVARNNAKKRRRRKSISKERYPTYKG